MALAYLDAKTHAEEWGPILAVAKYDVLYHLLLELVEADERQAAA
jgi:hypothetical protein